MPGANDMLGRATWFLRAIQGKTDIEMPHVGAMMGPGGGGVVNNYNITVETQKEAEHADKITRKIADTKVALDAKAPIN